MYSRTRISGAEGGKDHERREGQTEQGQKQQIHPVAVEVIQQISRHRTEQDGGHGHGREHDADPGAGDPDLLAVDGDDGDGCVKGCQYKQVGDEQEDKSPVPDFFGFFQ